MVKELIRPEVSRPATLMKEITAILSQLPFVSHILIFGSLARNEADRWSDIDMLVVTKTHQQFWDAWQQLHDSLPILHHHPFAELESGGAHALGNVFVDESVFHCLDLNFFTIDDYQRPGITERFGHLDQIYHNPDAGSSTSQHPSQFQQVLTSDEEKISVEMHFLKKNIKKVLRNQPAHHEVKKFADRLSTIMEDYTFEYEVVGGKIGKLAEIYLTIAECLLDDK